MSHDDIIRISSRPNRGTALVQKTASNVMDPRSVYNPTLTALRQAAVLKGPPGTYERSLPKWRLTKIYCADRLTHCSIILTTAPRIQKIIMS